MSKPIFYNKSGTLTKYALSCGYVEQHGNARLFRDGCYHVQDSETQVWETFGKLKDARQFFTKLKGRK